MDKTGKLTVLELLCVFFWLLFDGFWLMEWMWLTYASSLISFSLAIAIFFYMEKGVVAFLIGLVDTFWLLMNIFWIVSDFSKLDWALNAAKISFWLGIAAFILAFTVGKPGRSVFELVLRRLRIFRLFV